MEEFKTRLVIYARTAHDMGHTRFEDYCGLSHGTISAIKASGPSASTLERILVKCPDLNARWLITGDGEMLEKKEAPVMDTDAKQAIYDLTLENVRLKKRIAELEGKGAVAV